MNVFEAMKSHCNEQSFCSECSLSKMCDVIINNAPCRWSRKDIIVLNETIDKLKKDHHVSRVISVDVTLSEKQMEEVIEKVKEELKND